MPKYMKIALAALGAVVLLCLIAVVVVVSTVDPNDYKDEIAETVLEKTGRNLVFEGDIGFSFFPFIGFRVGPLFLGNAPGFDDTEMVRVNKAEASLRIAPLLGGKVEVGKVLLDGLTLRLSKNSQGIANWEDLAQGGKESPDEVSDGSAEVRQSGGLDGLSVQGVEITNASLIYEDMQKGTTAEIRNLNLTLGRINGAESFPFELGFELKLDQPRLELHPTMAGDIRLDQAAGEFALDNLKFSVLNMTGSGQIHAGMQDGQPSYSGDMHMAVASCRELLQTLGVALPETGDPEALKELSATAAFKGTANSVELDKLQLTLDATALSATGHVQNFADPAITMAVRVDGIDLGRYLPAQPAKQVSASSVAAEPAVTVSDTSEQNTDAAVPETPAWEQAREALRGMNLDASFGIDSVRYGNADGSTRFFLKSQNGNVDFYGGLQLAASSVRDVLQKAGVEIPETADPDVLQGLNVYLSLKGTDDSAELENLSVELDDTTLTVQGAVKNFAAPEISVAVQVNAMDVDRYLPPQSEADSKEVESSPKTTQDASTASASEPDLRALRELNLDASLAVGELKVMNVTTSNIKLGIVAKNGVLKAEPVSLDLYDGYYAGQGSLDVRGEVPAWTEKGMLEDMQTRDLLTDLLGKDVLNGVAFLSYDLNGKGLTPERIKKSVSGKAAFSLTDGEVIGVDIAKMIRDAWNKIQDASVEGEESGNFDFSKVSGTAALKNGHIVNRDLTVKSPLLQVRGAGWADLPRNTTDYAATVTVVGSLEGLEGDILSIVQDVPLPVKVTGSLTKPDIGLDMKTMTQLFLEGTVNEVVKIGLDGLGAALLEDGEDTDSGQDDSAESVDSDGPNKSDGSELINLIDSLF